MRLEMTATQYAEELSLIKEEVNTCIECFYTYIEIHNYATENRSVHRAMNGEPMFWNISLYSLQAAFFMTLGRIFDNGRDAHSIHKLLAATVAHPEFFSKEALGTRRAAGGPKPDWLDTFLRDAFEPEASDLRALKRALTAHRTSYDAAYAEIRNLVFAHKIRSSKDEVAALFGKAIVKEIDDMLYNLRDILETLHQLFLNGRRPELGSQPYDYQNRIKKDVRETLGKLVSGMQPDA